MVEVGLGARGIRVRMCVICGWVGGVGKVGDGMRKGGMGGVRVYV